MAYRSLRKFKQEQREYGYRQEREQDAYFGDDDPPITEAELEAIASGKHFEQIDYPRTNKQWGGFA